MPRGPLLTDKEKDLIHALDKEGVDISLIKERTGRSIATIYKVLREKPVEAPRDTATA